VRDTYRSENDDLRPFPPLPLLPLPIRPLPALTSQSTNSRRAPETRGNPRRSRADVHSLAQANLETKFQSGSQSAGNTRPLVPRWYPTTELLPGRSLRPRGQGGGGWEEVEEEDWVEKVG